MAVLRDHALFGYGRESRRRHLASPGALAATVFDRLTEHKPFLWARRFRQFSGRPVFYVPTPRTASNVLKVHFKGRWPFRLRNEEMVAFAACVDRATDALCSEIGMALLAQPPVTLESPLFTKDEYRRDNDNSPVRNKTGMDPNHMNGAFGEHFWRTHMPRILAELEAASPPSLRPTAMPADIAPAFEEAATLTLP